MLLYYIGLLLSRTPSISITQYFTLLSRFLEARERKLMAQQMQQMQQMQQLQQLQQLQQIQQWQKLQQMQQMQSMVGGPKGRGVQMVRYQAIPGRGSFAQPMMMAPQGSQMMGRKKERYII